jgi:subtilisin family serine protease
MSQTCADPFAQLHRHQGQGHTIYVIDAGFRRTHEDFAETDRTVREYVVPNEFTLGFGGTPENLWAPQDIADISRSGHGTKVASVAAGVNQGVAPLANLVLIKFRNAVEKIDGSGLTPAGVTDAALRDAWDYVINDVKKGNHVGRPIVVMSYGWPRPTDSPLPSNRESIMASALDECREQTLPVSQTCADSFILHS